MLSVQNNLYACNVSRQLKINVKKNAKGTEKLSSGYRINRAADDAAGLAISEKMRRQIRGLRQGSDNIQEGISLVQTADGALEEVIDILQRINELSIKAYNDTNTQEDRDYIQQEVVQSIKEIERIADTTTFNEIKVLKGNPKQKVKIEEDKVYTGYFRETVECAVPDWLKNGIDEKLELHGYSSGFSQDIDNAKMFKVIQYDADGHAVKGEYYGPLDEGTLYDVYTYSGSWTPGLSDNSTAKISFSNLAGCDDAVTLYQNMVELLGCAVGVPCGTCDDVYYGIGFSGETDGFMANPLHHTNSAGRQVKVGAALNLSEWKGFVDDAGEAVNCFDKIKEHIKRQALDDSLSEDAKKGETLRLADEIAQKLCARTYQCITNVTEYKEHFDRALTDGKYDIIVYDYRDRGKLAQMQAADAKVNAENFAEVKIPYSYMVPGTEVEIGRPLNIVCSAQWPDIIPIDLPLLTVEALGITGYDVGRYRIIETYSDSYKAKLDAWENAFHYETRTIPEHEVEYIEKKLVSSTPIFNENGELVRMDSKYEEKKVSGTAPASTYRVKVYDYPKPAASAGDVTRTLSYEPDNNRRIKDALAYVLECRTTLGAEQNRLEHAYNSNQNKLENTTASESIIRDADMAKETVATASFRILMQAGVSMLSQANQSSASILQLIQ